MEGGGGKGTFKRQRERRGWSQVRKHEGPPAQRSCHRPHLCPTLQDWGKSHQRGPVPLQGPAACLQARGRRGTEGRGPCWEVPSTLGGEHGTCRLLEVQELLQEEDGLHRGENGSRKKVMGRSQRSNHLPQGTPCDHSRTSAGPGVCPVNKVAANFVFRTLGWPSTSCPSGH